jgi:hypothetical protein
VWTYEPVEAEEEDKVKGTLLATGRGIDDRLGTSGKLDDFVAIKSLNRTAHHILLRSKLPLWT